MSNQPNNAPRDLVIREDDLTGPDVIRLLRQHLDNMHAITPPGSVYALDVEALRGPGITFWTAWEDDELLGCAALKELDENHGEIKSMRTAEQHRGRGVASSLLEHLMRIADRRGYDRLSLETGSTPAFEPARALYRRYGFEACDRFADYEADPHSSFMTRRL